MAVSVLLALALAPGAEPSLAADLVLLSGKVWTVDPAKPQAEAFSLEFVRRSNTPRI